MMVGLYVLAVAWWRRREKMIVAKSLSLMYIMCEIRKHRIPRVSAYRIIDENEAQKKNAERRKKSSLIIVLTSTL